MRVFLSSLLFLAAAALASCTPANRGEPAVWRITDADSEIWLYGAVHLLPPDLRWRGPAFEAAFAAADELVVETNTDEAGSAMIAALAQRLGALPEGQSLSTLLSDAQIQALRREARRLGIDFAALDRQRPWLTALQLSYAAAVSAGHSPDYGVETYLMREAAARGLRISYLETPEQQVRILAGLSPEDQIRLLDVTLEDVRAGADALAVMDRAWARGDVERLEALLGPQWQAAGPGVHDAVIIQRNRAWVDQIEARLAGSGRVFIAVGAAHLVREDSVIDLLRERGIAVEGP